MPYIEFKNDGIGKDVAEGTRVIDLCEELGTTLPFGCRSGMCGTCLCTVVEGLENLPPPSEDEALTLSGFDAKPDQRLACQLALVKGKVVLEYST